VTLYYRNDDGGPGYGKDSWLEFDPPADGTYVVRVEDVRGQSGPGFGYHLVVRPPAPDFRVNLSAENINVPRGGATIVTANVTRLDGFRGALNVTLENLPAGITATAARIEPDLYSADLIVMADAAAEGFTPPTFTVTAKAEGVDPSDSGAVERVHTVDPGGPQAGWITVTPEPNLKMGFRSGEIVIHPGERIEMTLSVERNPAYKGRVPIDVRNLPRGVRVLNIGLNGVLVTEQQTERNIFIYAEPWAEATDRPFFAVGKCEAVGTEHSSRPIRLLVRPKESKGSKAATATSAR
jgi:hypothetical protein